MQNKILWVKRNQRITSHYHLWVYAHPHLIEDLLLKLCWLVFAIKLIQWKKWNGLLWMILFLCLIQIFTYYDTSQLVRVLLFTIMTSFALDSSVLDSFWSVIFLSPLFFGYLFEPIWWNYHLFQISQMFFSKNMTLQRKQWHTLL